MRPASAAATLWLWTAMAAAAAPPAAEGGAAPVIREIAFEGNETTRPEVMLREMVIKPGDPADPVRIERSRQAIQDLGLFRSVDVVQTAVPGGVRLTYTVKEKWYILPIPRVDANSEGENAYGMSLRWYNVGGRNHTLRGNWTRRDEEKLNMGESTSYSASYALPFAFDTPYGLSFGGGHSETPISDPADYTESFDSFFIGISRAFADRSAPASQGWSTGISLGWSVQKTEGVDAPAPYGHATTLGFGAGYRDIRYNIYSEEGLSYGFGLSGAAEGLGSEYSYGTYNFGGTRYFLVGERPHQNLNFGFAFGSYHGGPTEHTTSTGAFGIGGTSRLRAYPSDFIVGDFYYHVGAEYLRPLYFDWLRAAVVLEAGNAFPDASEPNDRVYANIGFGLRLRLTFLVNVEVEAGIALPLDDLADTRFFASKV